MDGERENEVMSDTGRVRVARLEDVDGLRGIHSVDYSTEVKNWFRVSVMSLRETRCVVKSNEL